MLSRIKKDDTVVVLSGKDKGKQGQVLLVDRKKNVVLVKNIGVLTKHKKAKKSGEKSSIIKEEGFLPLCKFMPVCPACKKACRIQISIVDSKKNKHRICARCKEAF